MSSNLPNLRPHLARRPLQRAATTLLGMEEPRVKVSLFRTLSKSNSQTMTILWLNIVVTMKITLLIQGPRTPLHPKPNLSKYSLHRPLINQQRLQSRRKPRRNFRNRQLQLSKLRQRLGRNPLNRQRPSQHHNHNRTRQTMLIVEINNRGQHSKPSRSNRNSTSHRENTKIPSQVSDQGKSHFWISSMVPPISA